MRVLFALALVACTRVCRPIEVAQDGELVGTILHRDETWRVQIHELPEGCGGTTTSGARTVSLAPELDDDELRTMAAHEVGHVLGLPHSSDADALMAPEPDHDVPQRADLPGCRAEGVCPRSFSRLDRYASAVERACDVWNAITIPEHRLEFRR